MPCISVTVVTGQMFKVYRCPVTVQVPPAYNLSKPTYASRSALYIAADDGDDDYDDKDARMTIIKHYDDKYNDIFVDDDDDDASLG